MLNFDLARDDGHEGQGVCWYAVWIKGNVTEILENERINTAAGQGARVI